MELGCTTCDGTGTLHKGMRAEVRGTVVTVDPPVLDVISVKYLEGDTQGCTEMASTTSDADMTENESPALAPAEGEEASDGAKSTIELAIIGLFVALGLVSI